MDLANSRISSLPFSDQSHLLFYARSSVARRIPLFSSRYPSCRASFFPETLPIQSCDSQASLFDQEAALLQKFSDLKLSMKQKKKQLKALEKQAKKTAKRNTVKVKKTKDCDSSSSSSSESSDDEGRNMKTLTKGLGLGFAEIGLGHMEALPMSRGAEGKIATEIRTGDITVASNPPACSSKGVSAMVGGKIQVCTGGKCRKAGSEQLMASLREKIPSSCGVETVPCKCMSKCAMAINVKVQKDETNPQHHCHVGPNDADHILNRYFGVGPQSSDLPLFSATKPSCSTAPELHHGC